MSESKEQKPTRRTFLKLLGLGTVVGLGAGVTAGVVKIAEGVGKALEKLPGGENAFGRYLAKDAAGRLVVTGQPQAVEVEFSPAQDPESLRVTRGKIPLRNQPWTKEEATLVSPEGIESRYAVRVLGATFPASSSFGNVNATWGEKTASGGLWFQLTDKKGNSVNPNGLPLTPGEQPYFVSANFVTVIPPKQ